MDKWAGKLAIVTGSASGIGAATAKKLLEEGVTVVGVDLQPQDPSPSTFHPIKADITSESQILEAFAWIQENLGPVHVLVNCAGVMENTSLIEGKTELWRKTFDVNVLGVCVFTREAVRVMKRHNLDGHVVHINSVVGHVVLPSRDVNVYPASKHAVTALAQVLRQELDAIGSKIRVTSISPGPTKTPLMIKRYSSTGLPKRPYLNPEDVADAVMYALSTPEHVQISELTVTPI